MKQMILLIGNISSGKSTFTNMLSSMFSVNVVSRDKLRYMLGNGKYDFGRQEVAIAKSEEVLVKEIMKTGESLIIDDASNSILSIRQKWLTIAKYFKYEVIVIEMQKFSMKDSVERRLKDNHGNITKKVWEQTYKKFKSWYTEPKLEEGITTIFRFTNDSKVNTEIMAEILFSIHSDEDRVQLSRGK